MVKVGSSLDICNLSHMQETYRVTNGSKIVIDIRVVILENLEAV